MTGLTWETPEEMDLALARRIRNIRRRRKISQEKLSELSGVSLGSIKRFEGTGMISLLSLTKIAVGLDLAGEIRGMFSHIAYRDIAEVIREQHDIGKNTPEATDTDEDIIGGDPS